MVKADDYRFDSINPDGYRSDTLNLEQSLHPRAKPMAQKLVNN
jgi:hypothetical protein